MRREPGRKLETVIITTNDGAGGAVANAKNLDLADRVEILEIEQFLATNLLEWSKFKREQRPITVRELISKYNEIVTETETDPSLKIAVD